MIDERHCDPRIAVYSVGNLTVPRLHPAPVRRPTRQRKSPRWRNGGEAGRKAASRQVWNGPPPLFACGLRGCLPACSLALADSPSWRGCRGASPSASRSGPGRVWCLATSWIFARQARSQRMCACSSRSKRRLWNVSRSARYCHPGELPQPLYGSISLKASCSQFLMRWKPNCQRICLLLALLSSGFKDIDPSSRRKLPKSHRM